MPNRIIRDGILDSDRMEQLFRDGGWAAEVFYRRLMSVVDDYGRFDGRVSVIKARCYPTVLDSVRDADLVRWIAACEKASLIRIYSVQSKRYVCILDFNQQTRSRSKYPAPEDGDAPSPCKADAQQMLSKCAADDKHLRTKTETKAQAQTRDGAGTPAISLSDSPDPDPGNPTGRGNAPIPGDDPPHKPPQDRRKGHQSAQKPLGRASPPGIADGPIAADPEGIGLLPTEIGPKAACPPTESERAAAVSAFDQWSAMARGHPLKTHENEHKPIWDMLDAMAILPPLIVHGQQVPRHRLVPRAVEVLKANATPFRNPKFACGCVKNKLSDWESEGVPGPGGKPAKSSGKTTADMMREMANFREEY